MSTSPPTDPSNDPLKALHELAGEFTQRIANLKTSQPNATDAEKAPQAVPAEEEASSPNDAEPTRASDSPPPSKSGSGDPPATGPQFTRARVAAFLVTKAGTQVCLVIGLFVAIYAVNWYAGSLADEKTADWFTSYNGVASTIAVGRITSDLDTKTTPTPTPSPIPTPSPSPSPTPTPALDDKANLTLTTNITPNIASKSTVATSVNTNSAATPTPFPSPNVDEKQRLAEQLATIRDRTKHHGAVMAYFFKTYYVAIVMVMFAGVIAAVTLFFIAQKGWEHTDDRIETVFIVMTAVVAFYALFPPVFQQDKNISDNKELFLQYKSLESEVQSYPLTHTTLKNELKTPREFINHIDVEMDRIGNIALGFDISKIDYKGAIDLNKKAATQENAPRPTPTPPRVTVKGRK